MGAKESSLMGSLAGWWYVMRHKETMIFGPQLGFNLRSPDGKTVLIFGEDHRYKNVTECGEDQKLFTDLYEQMLLQPKCENMQVILEISDDYKRAVGRGVEGNRIFTMLEKYYQKYNYNPDCKILLQFANLDNSNVLLIKDLQIIQKHKNKQDVLHNDDFMESFQRHITNTFRLFKRNIFNFCIPEKQNDIFKTTLVKPLFADMDQLSSKLDNITADNIETIAVKAYYISLRIMDAYAIACVMSNNLNSLVYMGLLHSTFIASYLITNFGYHLMDLANPISDHCIRIDDEAFDNIYIKIKKLVCSKDKTTKEYLLEIFNNIENKIMKKPNQSDAKDESKEQSKEKKDPPDDKKSKIEC